MNEKINALDGFLRGMIQSELTPCATMAAIKDNRLVYSFAEGRSRLGGSGAMAVDGNTQFNVGSVTKPVTASLVVKLAEQGRLTLEDPVKRYIPEFRFENVTLMHLMTHTAGYDPAIDSDLLWLWHVTPAGMDKYLEKIIRSTRCYTSREAKRPIARNAIRY